MIASPASGRPIEPSAIARSVVWMPGSEHRVGRAADLQPQRGRLVEQRPGGRAVEPQRLLAPHVLARADRRGGDLDVGGGIVRFTTICTPGWSRTVCSDAGDRHAVGLGLRCCPFGVEVADGDDLDIRVPRKVRQVLGRDGSGSGQADPDRHHRALR